MSNETMIRPNEIFAAIKAQPPLMRGEAAKRYIGQSVDWLVSFVDGSEHSDGIVEVMFRIAPGDLKMVVGRVPLASYPQLRIMPSEAGVRLRGRIQRINGLFIELKIEDLAVEESYSTHQS